MRKLLIEALFMAPIALILALLTSGVMFVVLVAISATLVVKMIEGGE